MSTSFGATSFGTTSASNVSELRRFLSEAFAISEPPANLCEEAMRWKYFDPHPLWPEGRSYQLRAGDRIAAHGCVTPVHFQNGDQEVRSLQVIDWAAGRLIPGAGLLLYRKCLELNQGTLLAIGGGEDTLKIIPMVKWFQPKQELRFHARPLRPFGYAAHERDKARALGRLVRNLPWKLFPPLPSPQSWTCREIAPGEPVFTPKPALAGGVIPIRRTRAWFDYLVRCPLARVQILILENAGKAAGHAFLSTVRGSVRVADFALGAASSREQRAAAFSAVVRYVGSLPDALEITAGSNVEEVCQAFKDCGLRHRTSVPVFLADPRKQLPAACAIEVTPVIGDAFYLANDGYPFSC